MAKLNQKKELGKGIRALLGDINQEINGEDKKLGDVMVNSKQKNTLPIDKIEVNPSQPRTHFDEEALDELSQSIKIHGLIQPITVRKIDDGVYQIISGERRYRASILAGLEEVPVYIRTANDQESLEMALIENIQRENLNAIEIGINYKRLIDECSLSHEELANRMGKKRTTVTNYLRLLKLPPDIQVAVRGDIISMGHARTLAGIEEIEIQLDIFKEIIKKELSVRQTEQLVNQRLKNSTPKSSNEKNAVHPMVRKWQDKVSSALGTKTTINPKSNGSGVIILDYATEEDLERIIEQLL